MLILQRTEKKQIYDKQIEDKDVKALIDNDIQFNTAVKEIENKYNSLYGKLNSMSYSEIYWLNLEIESGLTDIINYIEQINILDAILDMMEDEYIAENEREIKIDYPDWKGIRETTKELKEEGGADITNLAETEAELTEEELQEASELLQEATGMTAEEAEEELRQAQARQEELRQAQARQEEERLAAWERNKLTEITNEVNRTSDNLDDLRDSAVITEATLEEQAELVNRYKEALSESEEDLDEIVREAINSINSGGSVAPSLPGRPRSGRPFARGERDSEGTTYTIHTETNGTVKIRVGNDGTITAVDEYGLTGKYTSDGTPRGYTYDSGTGTIITDNPRIGTTITMNDGTTEIYSNGSTIQVTTKDENGEVKVKNTLTKASDGSTTINTVAKEGDLTTSTTVTNYSDGSSRTKSNVKDDQGNTVSEEETVTNSDGSWYTRYTDKDGNEWNQRTNPDGSVLRYGTDDNGNKYEWVVNSDGTGHYTMWDSEGQIVVDRELDGDASGGDSSGD